MTRLKGLLFKFAIMFNQGVPLQHFLSNTEPAVAECSERRADTHNSKPEPAVAELLERMADTHNAPLILLPRDSVLFRIKRT